MADAGDAAGEFKFGSGVKYGDEAFGDEVEHLGLDFAEFGECAGGDDGKVVADFFVIEHTLGFGELWAVGLIAIENGFGIGRKGREAIANVAEGGADGTDVVLGQVFGVRSRIREHLVLLVECLSDL